MIEIEKRRMEMKFRDCESRDEERRTRTRIPLHLLDEFLGMSATNSSASMAYAEVERSSSHYVLLSCFDALDTVLLITKRRRRLFLYLFYFFKIGLIGLEDSKTLQKKRRYQTRRGVKERMPVDTALTKKRKGTRRSEATERRDKSRGERESDNRRQPSTKRERPTLSRGKIFLLLITIKDIKYMSMQIRHVPKYNDHHVLRNDNANGFQIKHGKKTLYIHCTFEIVCVHVANNINTYMPEY